MVITLELPPEVEAKLREDAAKHDNEAVRRVLMEALTPVVDATVPALMHDSARAAIPRPDGLTDEEFETLADDLIAMLPALPELPDSAITREAIYEGHPCGARALWEPDVDGQRAHSSNVTPKKYAEGLRGHRIARDGDAAARVDSGRGSLKPMLVPFVQALGSGWGHLQALTPATWRASEPMLFSWHSALERVVSGRLAAPMLA